MALPIRSSTEISVILNKAQNALADLGLQIVNEKKQGITNTDSAHRDKIYRMLLLRAFLQHLITADGVLTQYYLSTATFNQQKLNKILDGLVHLSKGFSGDSIPLLARRNLPLLLYSSSLFSTMILAEEAARIAGDANEAAARVTADTALQNNINSEASARIAGDANEAAARVTADTALQNNINSEASARIAGDATLQNNINTEASVRASSDGTLQNNINTEISNRTSADTVLQNEINAISLTNKSIINIGNWNIYVGGGGTGSATKSVVHGLSDFTKIRSVNVIIRNDSNADYYFFPLNGVAANYVDSVNVNLNSSLNLPAFANDSSYNRGWITIEYLP